MGQILNLDGQKFHKLTATNQLRRHKGRTQRLCHCECGNTIWLLTHSLLSGHTKACGCMRKLPEGQAARNRLLLDYKLGAKRRSPTWLLTDNEFDRLVSGDCYFCGRAPSRMRRQRHCNGAFYNNGIDRLDNNRGYKANNVVTCCKLCNYAKNNMTLSDFLGWVRDLKENCKT